MSTLVDGKPIRLRGGSKHSQFKVSFPFNAGCTQNLIDEVAPFYEASDVSENEADHIIPRKSTTVKQHLGIFSRSVIDSIEVKGKQLIHLRDKNDKLIPTTEMVKVSERRTLKLSDTTLLKQGNPFIDAKYSRDPIKRRTAVSKRIQVDHYPNYMNIEDPKPQKQTALDPLIIEDDDQF